MNYILMCRSLTTAQKAARILERQGIHAYPTKAPQQANPRGCTYGVSVAERYLDAARTELTRADITFEAIPEQKSGGKRGEAL